MSRYMSDAERACARETLDDDQRGVLIDELAHLLGSRSKAFRAVNLPDSPGHVEMIRCALRTIESRESFARRSPADTPDPSAEGVTVRVFSEEDRQAVAQGARRQQDDFERQKQEASDQTVKDRDRCVQTARSLAQGRTTSAHSARSVGANTVGANTGDPTNLPLVHECLGRLEREVENLFDTWAMLQRRIASVSEKYPMPGPTDEGAPSPTTPDGAQERSDLAERIHQASSSVYRLNDRLVNQIAHLEI